MKKRISESVADAWGVPKDVIMNIPRMTISGDKEIYIEHHKGIMEYTDTEIRVSTAMGTVRVKGKKLVIERIRLEDLLISGTFTRIEYEI
ncbi:MAG: sporulation protein YqfC [Clostridia bacterium]|nr:sporulation protein YqfC [Clostridia bacterium]